MLNFYLPDFYNNANLICLMADLLKHYPDNFYDDIRIGAAYGSFPGAIWNGGRVIWGIEHREAMEKMIKEYNDRGIAVRYTFTNPFIEEQYFLDKISSVHRIFVFVLAYSISSNAPVSESMINPRTTMSLGTRGWVLMVSTVLRTDSGVSLKPSSQ